MSSLMLAGVSSAETPEAKPNARRSPSPGSHRIIKPAIDAGWQSVNSGTSATSMRSADLRTPVEAINAVEGTLQRYEAALEEYGYRRYKNVMTAKDLDEMLRYQGKLSRPSDGRLPTKIAFFQCVGSRDESIGNLYCSQVCCAYALRLIKALRHQYPQIEVTFLYMDIQPAGASFQPFLDSCRQDKGIRLIRSLPSKVYNTYRIDGLRVRLTDPQKDAVVEESFDLIVLSVGMVLRKRTKTLLEFFHLTLTEDGFIASPSSRTGVFVTGACTGPKDIDRSILQAKSTAFQVQQYLREST